MKKFKVELSKFLKEVYEVDLESVDGEIDDYYVNMEYTGPKPTEDEYKKVEEYIRNYNETHEYKLKTEDITNVVESILSFKAYRESSNLHYDSFVQTYKDKVIDDFKNAEKLLYDREYLIACGVYDEDYSFDLNVDINGMKVIFDGDLETLDAIIMGCDGGYCCEDFDKFKEDFGEDYEQRLLNGLSYLKRFSQMFDAEVGIFKKEDLSYLYGQCYVEPDKVEYEDFFEWLGTFEASELLENI